MEKVIGPRIHHYMDTISETTRAVVYGVGLTAIAQAIGWLKLCSGRGA